MERYSEYKDSGVEWLGEIPSHWKVDRSGRAIKFIKGITVEQRLLSSDDTGLKYVRTNDIYQESAISKDSVYVEGRVDSKYIKSAEEYVISFDGFNSEVGKGTVGLVTNECAGVINGHIARIESKSAEYLKRYCEYSMANLLNQQLMVLNARGSISKSCGHMKDRLIILKAPIEEQQKIAQYLDTKTQAIDQLITKKQQLVANLKLAKQALITETVTKGLDPTVKMKDSGVEWIGEIPEHWVKCKLKHCVNTKKGYAFKSMLFNINNIGIPVIKASDIKNKTILSGDTCIDGDVVGTRVVGGDIILSTVGSAPQTINSAVGQIGVVPESMNGNYLNQNTVIFKAKQGIINRYLYYILDNKMYRSHLDFYAHGTANQCSMSIVDMLDFDMYLPKVTQQLQIVEYLDKKVSEMDSLISLEQESIDTLKKTKQKLITEVVTGKINVQNL